MKTKDKNKIIERYENRLNELGPVQESLGWLKGRQKLRFFILKNIDKFNNDDSVLDVGCAFGDLKQFLIQTGWNGRYVGIDIVPALILQAHKKYKNIDARVLDILVDEINDEIDWVFCSGALTSKTEEEDSYSYLKKMLVKMFEISKKGVSVNFCSPNVTFESDVNFHPNFDKILKIVCSITKRFSLIHDYMPYEFTLYLYKDDSVNSNINIFNQFNDLHNTLK